MEVSKIPGAVGEECGWRKVLRPRRRKTALAGEAKSAIQPVLAGEVAVWKAFRFELKSIQKSRFKTSPVSPRFPSDLASLVSEIGWSKISLTRAS